MGISALLAAQILDASATGRSVLTGADASAIRSTLGLGTLATQSPTGTPSASTFLRGDYSWQTIDLSGYVPYSGATGAVNLGANGLTASQATLSAGTLNGSVLDIAQTWGGTGTYTGIKYNVTDSGPANAASLLMDLQVGGTSRLALDKNGWLRLRDSLYSLGVITNLTNVPYMVMSTAQLYLNTSISLSNNNPVNGPDVVLTRDAANTLAQRNGTNQQRFNLYGTYTDASNYRRLFLSSTTAGAFTLGVEGAGTGASGNTLELQVAGVTGLTIQYGQAMFPAGSKTAPGLRIAGSSTVGFFSSGTQLYFSDGGGGGADSLGFVGGLRLPRVNYLNFTSTTSATDVPDTRYGRDSSSSKALIGAANGLSVKTYDFTADAPVSASLATLSTGTITASTPALNVSQTWNNAAVAFNALSIAITDTASDSLSTSLDISVSGQPRLRHTVKNTRNRLSLFSRFAGSDYEQWYAEVGTTSGFGGFVSCPGGFMESLTNSPGAFSYISSVASSNFRQWYFAAGSKIKVGQSTTIEWYGADFRADTNTSDLVLLRDAAQTLAQRNGTNPQVHRVYNTFTDASNYERAKVAWESNVLRIGTEKAGTGSARALELQTDGVTRLTIGTTGTATFSAGIFAVAQVINQNIQLRSDSADGVLLVTGYDQSAVCRIQLGDTTSSFPAIKRNAAALNFRLADDSGDCDITAKAATFSGNVTISAVNLVTDTTTGTKIGTATTQKLGFYNSTPVVQPTAVADATDAASVITQLNALLSRMRDLGLIAT